MPGSAISAGTGSQTSVGSRRAKTRQYYKVANTSQVDESLFGSSNNNNKLKQQPKQDDIRAETPIELQARQRSSKRNANAKPKKETVQVITKDLIRNLVVPTEDPSGESLVIDQYDYYRLRDAARVLTPEEKAAREDELRKWKEEQINDVLERKNYMKMKDLQRVKNESLNELEEEERLKREELKQMALEKLQEQEDEIKKLNELILNAKCHAIRDAQILERDQIKREMEVEEKRLDKMMELDRVNAIHVDEEIEAKRKQERLLGAMKVMEQIQENEQERLLELERKDQENRLMQKYLDKLCEEEADKLDKRHAEQLQLREDLHKCNADIIKRKELSKEQEMMLEKKVLQYQKDKAEREAAFEREQERQRIEKEREVARLRALQERARDEQAERDALRAKRAQEQAEREWRKKEAEEARQKAETEAMLKAARAQQMEQKEHFLAVQAQRERGDFERVLQAQQELIEKDKREEDVRLKKRAAYADEVRAQIREKEQLRISERNAFFEEGVKLDEEARRRRAELEAIKKKKLDELRAAGIHERYLAQIERKINQPQQLSV